jgi:hypothetical protein
MTISLLKNLFFAIAFCSCATSSLNKKLPEGNKDFDKAIPAEPDLITDTTPQSLMDLPQTQYGGFILKPGFYEAEFKTYCLQPGTPDPREGDAYLQGPLTGYRKDIVESVLLNSRIKQDIEQKNIQLLLWSVVSGADFNRLSYPVQADAMRLLNSRQIFELKGGVMGMIKNVSYSSGIINTNSEMQRLFRTGISSYETYERLAVRREQSRVIKKGVKYDQWYRQNENYYVRYFPESYKKVKIQVFVPGSLLDAENKLNGEYVVFDPTGQQAVPAFTNAQRLGIGAPVIIAVAKTIIQVNKKPSVPNKTPERKNPKSGI